MSANRHQAGRRIASSANLNWYSKASGLSPPLGYHFPESMRSQRSR